MVKNLCLKFMIKKFKLEIMINLMFDLMLTYDLLNIEQLQCLLKNNLIYFVFIFLFE